MPELPEVETIKRGLESKIVGMSIQDIEICNPKSFQGDPRQIIGAKIVGLWRRGKVLGIDVVCHPEPVCRQAGLVSGSDKCKSKMPKPVRHDMQGEMTLLIHLKMSGQLILKSLQKSEVGQPTAVLAGGHPTADMLGDMPNKSTRVIFSLAEAGSRKPASRLYFNDQRKFGWIKLVPTVRLAEESFLNKLGPEPLDSGFSATQMHSLLSRRAKTPIKVALLDQELIAGVGNIYASEACFLANIHPKRLVSSLSPEDFQKLYQGLIKSLQDSIKYGGSSKSHYFNESGQKGYFLEVANVYDRHTQPCRVCQTPIVKITLGGRGTYFCPNCQPD